MNLLGFALHLLFPHHLPTWQCDNSSHLRLRGYWVVMFKEPKKDTSFTSGYIWFY